MSGKSKVKQTSEKVSEQSKKVESTPVAVVASQPSVEVTPQKGGKKSKVVEATTTVAATPVVVAASTVETTSTTQKGGKKGKVAATTPAVVATPVVAAAPVVAATPTTQKGGKKAAATTVAATATTVVAAPVEASTSTQKKAAKKPTAVAQEAGAKVTKAKVAKAPKVKEAKTPKVVKGGDDAAEEDDESSRHIRSFKVKLPGNEDFEGRFTGLTPYQAANKALSKYFREAEEPSSNVTFSICESTRKSKKSVYTYVGNRQKLDIPVTYTIQDGRVITKNFKNSLKKVKKAETTEQKTVVASA
jgi:hypothetical protein